MRRPTIGQCPSSAVQLQAAEKLEQHGSPRRLPGGAGRRHRPRHRALDLRVVEATRAVAVRDPGALHFAQFCLLLIIEIGGEALVVLVEEIVPNCPFEAIAIGGTDVGLAFGFFRAWRADQVEQALPVRLRPNRSRVSWRSRGLPRSPSSSACGFGRGRPHSQRRAKEAADK